MKLSSPFSLIHPVFKQRLSFGQHAPAEPDLAQLFDQTENLARQPQDTPQLPDLLTQLRRKVFETITSLRRATETDPLTGLRNRAFFDRKLATHFEDARQNGKPLSVIMVDLDRFKKINDQFGHDVGDQALIRFSQALRQAVGERGYACRLGGDEFAVLLPDATLPVARETAEDIRTVLSQSALTVRHQNAQHTLHLASSQGIATLDVPAKNGYYLKTAYGDAATRTDFLSLGLDVPVKPLTKPKLSGLQRFNPAKHWNLRRLWQACQKPAGVASIPSQLVNIADQAMYSAKKLAKLFQTRHPILGRQTDA